MAKLRVKYTSIDPHYSTFEQTFISETKDECEQILKILNIK